MAMTRSKALKRSLHQNTHDPSNDEIIKQELIDHNDFNLNKNKKNYKKIKPENEDLNKSTLREDDTMEYKPKTSTRKSNRQIKKESESDEDKENEIKKSLVSKSKANFEKKIEETVKTVKFTGKVPVDAEFSNSKEDSYSIMII
jgi:hypothetical protein